MLLGLLVDVSGSMVASIGTNDREQQSRLESFESAFDEMVSKAAEMSRQGVGARISPLVRLFCYGFGFGGPFAAFFEASLEDVRDLLDIPGEESPTVSIDYLAAHSEKYKQHIKSLVPEMFGATPMLSAFAKTRDRIRRELEFLAVSGPPILFVASDGDPTDGSFDDVAHAATALKTDGVQIVSCLLTDEDLTSPRHLYAEPDPSWPSGANLMFECASTLTSDSPFAGYLRENRWSFDPGARMFTQINQSEILSEFLNSVLSPLSTVSPLPEEKPAEEAGKRPIRIFVTYSHQDEKYLADTSLLGYLSGLERDGFEFWTDQKIQAGELWQESIRRQLDQADVILALVSMAFLNSDYCRNVEVATAIERRKREGATILPIILSPCDWKREPWLAETQALPSRGRTIERDFRDKGRRDELYLTILESLRNIGQ